MYKRTEMFAICTFFFWFLLTRLGYFNYKFSENVDKKNLK